MRDDAGAPERVSLSVPTRTEHIGTVRNFVAAVAVHYGLSDDQIEDLKLAVSEICGDANESLADERILVEIGRSASTLDVEIAGIGMPAADATDDAAESRRFRRRLLDALIPDATFTPSDGGMTVRFRVETPS